VFLFHTTSADGRLSFLMSAAKLFTEVRAINRSRDRLAREWRSLMRDQVDGKCGKFAHGPLMALVQLFECICLSLSLFLSLSLSLPLPLVMYLDITVPVAVPVTICVPVLVNVLVPV
jgi:hypothetical protein